MREVLQEKMDEARVRNVFDKCASGAIDVEVVRTESPSLLAKLIVEEKTRFEVMGEISDEDEVLKMMEERLLSKQFRLVCMAENHWNSVRTVSTLEDEVTCPICDSRMIAAVHQSNQTLVKILEKRRRGEALSKKETRDYQAASLTAQLIARYGKTAILVLAGRGIGATTAARILNPRLKDRLDILRAIAKGELEYERTRPYW
jgi:ATP-dependent Lhr-like helicase